MAASSRALPPPDPCAHIEAKIPGGGMMYMAKRRADAPQLFCLGVGGLASMFDGVRVDGRDRLPVAIKQVALDRRAAERFEALHFRGLQTMTGRAHPGIVRFLGFFKGDDGGKDGKVRLSFAFERCPMARAFLVDAELRGGFTLPIESRLAQGTSEGCDLASNPLKAPPYSHAEALCVVRQLLRALEFLHSQAPPIIHRDVKPDNVLIWAAETRPRAAAAAGQGGQPQPQPPATPALETFLTVKLTDYDTVRRYDVGDLTVGSGTRSFMAPEVDVQTGTISTASSSRALGGAGSAPGGAKAVGHYGPDVDVFSAGATLFFLVSGHAPSPDLRMGDWRLRFLGDVPYEEEGAQAGAPAPLGSAAAASMAGGGGGGGGGVWGSSSGSGSSSRSLPAAAASAGAPPAVSILDHFFPPNSAHRAFLKGLVAKAPGDEQRRWTAAEALAALDRWFPDVPRL